MEPEDLCEILLQKTGDILECEYECECNLTITDTAGMQIINRETRGIDRVTDVLSFPNIDFDLPCNYECIDEDDMNLFEPDSGRLMLGDIIICYDKVLSQALEYGHTVKRELSFLIVHSLLHLYGYDHIDDIDRTLMEDMQRNILDTLNIKR